MRLRADGKVSELRDYLRDFLCFRFRYRKDIHYYEKNWYKLSDEL